MKSSSKQNTITSFFSSSATKKQKISDEQLNLSVTSTETEEIASSDALNLLGAIDSNVSVNFDATTTYKSQSIRSCLLLIDTDALAADSASPSVLSPTFIDTRASARDPASPLGINI